MPDDYVTFIRVTQASVLLPLLMGVLLFRRLDFFQRILWILVITSFVTECTARVIVYFQLHPNNLAIYNAYALAFMIFINRLYVRILDNKILKQFCHFALIALLLLAAINVLFLQPYTMFQSTFITASFSVNLLLAFLFFLQLLQTPPDQSIAKQPGFWLSVGIFIYSSATLLLFIFVNDHLAQYKAAILSPWGLNAMLFVILNLCYSVALWMPQKK